MRCGGIRTSVILRPCPKHWYLHCFRLFVQHTVQRMWNKTRCHKSQASMLLATMPKTVVFAVFLRICTTYCTRMWNKESPCLWRPCPKHLYLHRFFSRQVAGCGFQLTNSISETDAQCNKKRNLLLNAIVSWMSNYHGFPPNRAIS